MEPCRIYGEYVCVSCQIPFFLGLIFEKINGYKDGSFFTPGFITMYMCRETIRKAVVQKFNETKDWNCKDIDSIYDKIEDRQEAADEISNRLGTAFLHPSNDFNVILGQGTAAKELLDD